MAAASAPAAARRCGGASERVCHAATPASRASHTLTGRAAQALCAARGKGKCREGEGNTSTRKAPYVRSYENRRSAPRRGSGTICALRRGAMSAGTARQTPELDAPTARRMSLVLRCIHLGRREVVGRCNRVGRREAHPARGFHYFFVVRRRREQGQKQTRSFTPRCCNSTRLRPTSFDSRRAATASLVHAPLAPWLALRL